MGSLNTSELHGFLPAKSKAIDWVSNRSDEIAEQIKTKAKEKSMTGTLNWAAIHLEALLDYLDACGIAPLCPDGDKPGHQCPIHH